MQKSLCCFLMLIFFFSCSTTKQMEVVDLELRDLDTLFVEAGIPNNLKNAEDFKLPTYQATPKRTHDLIHTSLDLSFNWEKEQVLGKAELTLSPYFHPAEELVLDAKGFEIHKIEMEGKELEYQNSGKQLFIKLGRAMPPNEEYNILIDYTASPAASGGSAAITSDQGLFFVNPRNEDPAKPQQIWTQGETEWNSHWFPTIDKPNERCTQKTRLTVENRFKTLSNGDLVESIQNDNGTRTDIWEMRQAHAPYLFMLAIGEFAIVKDQWRDIPLTYYVDPKYEKHAKAIFNHTPEILEFFSNKLNYPYPWSKLGQMVVEDFVSGAMENTTSIIYGSFVQKEKRALIDNHNDGIVAHEIFHHWFGNLVTCESWANLAMNEGFANYSEYLWFEHQYGIDEAEFHFLGERRAYLYSTARNAHDLIHFSYRDKEDMFDAHSYNKGGAILHMLHDYVGDKAFWTALNKYLKDYEYQAVEAHDLRLVFEEVTGEDLNWFFNQWFFSTGHPDLKIEYDYDPDKKIAAITVEQLQDPEKMPAIFQAQVAVDLYFDGEKKRHKVWLNQRKQVFRFTVDSKPRLMSFDADYVLLKEFQDNKKEEDYVFQFKEANHFVDRYLALEFLIENNAEEELTQIIDRALKDKHWRIRQMAIQNIPEDISKGTLSYLKKLVINDPHSGVRSEALKVIDQLNDPEALELCKAIIDRDSAYTSIGTAVELIYKTDILLASKYVNKLENIESEAIKNSIASIYAISGNLDNLPYFKKNLEKVDFYSAAPFYSKYQRLAAFGDLEIGVEAMQNLKNIGVDQKQSSWRRLAAAKSITDMANEWQSIANKSKVKKEKEQYNKNVDILLGFFEEIKKVEENPQLQRMYRQIGLVKRI